MASFLDIFKLTKQLLPTGRAWRLPENSNIKKLFYALGKSEQRAFSFAVGTLNRILPDNDDFTAADATEWERRLNIVAGTGYVPLESRKANILRKYQFPGGFLNRQNYRYIEAQLQLAGYNVTITENYVDFVTVAATVHSLTTPHGLNTKHGNTAVNTDIVANSINKGELFDIDTYKGTFYVDGEVPVNAIKTFRQLILTLKPVNTVAILRVSYTNVQDLVYVGGGGIGLVEGGRLALVNR